jgi:4-amino-4-deoxy-L-arabinose transferase-like glycosyltransferase
MTSSQSCGSLSTTFRTHWAWWLAAFAALLWILRGLTLGQAPLFDTTEARYAGMAQLMLLTGDWVTARMPDDLAPFLGKPPLTFWLIATSMKWLGCNEWAARLPAYLEGTATLVFTFMAARQWVDRRSAWLAVILLASCPFFLVESGTVAMDTLVMLTVAASLWAIRGIQLARQKSQPWCRFALELFLALCVFAGLMNKGPISLILWMGPLVLWALAQWNWRALFLPNWLLVMGVGIAGSAPWYLACQKANPDFFHYFFIQEHFGRYVLKDYGDRYGSPHNQPYGMAWLYTIAAFAPWSLWFAAALPRLKQWWHSGHSVKALQPSTQFLLAWALFAPLFFSTAKSLLIPYMAVSLPPLAILAGRWLSLTLHRLSKPQPTHDLASTKTPGNLPATLASAKGWPTSLALVPVITWFGWAGLLGAFGALGYFCTLLNPLPVLAVIVPVIVLALLSMGSAWLAARVSPARVMGFVLTIALVANGAMAYWYGAIPDAMGLARSMKVVVQALQPRFPSTLHLLAVDFPGQSRAFSWYFYLRQGWTNALLRHGTPPPAGLGGKILVSPQQRQAQAQLPAYSIVKAKYLPRFAKERPDLLPHLILEPGRFYVYEARPGTPPPPSSIPLTFP